MAYTPCAGYVTAGANTMLWNAWNSDYFIGYNYQGTIVGTSNVLSSWISWNQTYQVTGIGTTANVWPAWNQVYLPSVISSGSINAPAQMPETQEQRLAREERDRIAKREREMLEAKRAAAKVRAAATLKSTLSRHQRDQFEKEGTFELMVGERLYRIRPGCRVERLDPATKKIKSYFCIHPANSYELPHEDTAISQKLLLEANEAEFLRLANETRVA